MLRFGTDGVRGVANAELTPELALALGRASARILGGDTVVIGRDSRRSGPMLEAALAAGFASEGLDVISLGVATTPYVAHASADLGVTGAVISASHNPFADNGIKLFAPGGLKLTDDVESQLEAELASVSSGGTASERPTGERVGTVGAEPPTDIAASYENVLTRARDGRSFAGLTVVLDCAHGAGSYAAPDLLRATGVEVVVVHAEPDGVNINTDAGSTAPEVLAAAVAAADADLGLALDGDADRLVAVDHTGRVVDGDHLLAILAIDRAERDLLPNDTVVATVMSNLGFRQAMAARSIQVVDTAVGDRYVLEALHASGAVLGGEQSGHIIQTDLATTGDGLLSAISLLDVVVRSGSRLADLAAKAMTSLPQVLVNVALPRRDSTLVDRLAADIAASEERLGDGGRVLVRASGTEPLIRVMVEAPTAEIADTEASRLAAAVENLAAG